MEENVETVKNPQTSNPIISGFHGFFTHPSIVWFYLLYFNTLLVMVVFNIFRKGLTPEGITGGPEYYSNLFWYFGLNQKPDYITPYGQGALAWLTAPFLVIFLGIPLFFLMEAGWSPLVDSAIKDLGSKDYAFFPSNPYGYEVAFFGSKKLNVFFIGVVWIPIIVSSIMLVLYMRRTKRKVHPVILFAVGFVISMALGLEFARIQSPDYYFNFERGWDSMVKFRNRSILVENYDSSAYHPTGMGLLLALFNIVTMIAGATVAAIMDIPKKIQEFKLAREIRMEKRRLSSDGGTILTPPWIKEREERKKAYEAKIAELKAKEKESKKQ